MIADDQFWYSSRRLAVAISALVLSLVVFLISAAVIGIQESIDGSINKFLVSNPRVVASTLDRELERIGLQVDKIASNKSLLTKEMSAIRRDISELLWLIPEGVEAYWIDKNGVIKVIEPPNNEAQGRAFSSDYLNNIEYRKGILQFDKSNNNQINFIYARKVRNIADEIEGFVAIRIPIAGLLKQFAHIFEQESGMISAIFPTRGLGHPIDLVAKNDVLLSQKLNSIRITNSSVSEQLLADDSYLVSTTVIERLPALLVTAIPKRNFLFSFRKFYGLFGSSVVLIACLFIYLASHFERLRTRQIENLEEGFERLSRGDFEARISSKDSYGMTSVYTSFNRMVENLRNSFFNSRVIAKEINEIGLLSDVDTIVQRTIDAIARHCQSDVVYFIPMSNCVGEKFGIVNVIKPWIFRNGRSYELQSTEEIEAAGRIIKNESSKFEFSLKNKEHELGRFKVIYSSDPSEHIILLMHAIVSISTQAVIRYESLQEKVLHSTEANLATSVYKNLYLRSLGSEIDNRIAFHFVPANRFGGDWFALIPDAKADRLFVVIGDVTGKGLVQGLVTTAINGALDAVESTLKAGYSEVYDKPSAIISLLDRSTRRIADSNNLTITCLVAEINFSNGLLRICNAGHTFPILLRNDGDAIFADYLYNGQQNLFGRNMISGISKPYIDYEHVVRERDFLIFYTDGLSDARNLKSQVFSRFLLRSLRTRSEIFTAQELKTKIIELYEYYTQGSNSDDDVCFLVIQTKIKNDLRALA